MPNDPEFSPAENINAIRAQLQTATPGAEHVGGMSVFDMFKASADSVKQAVQSLGLSGGWALKGSIGASAKLDELHQTLNDNPGLTGDQIHAAADEAVGTPGVTKAKADLAASLAHLNEAADKAVASGTMTLDQTKGIDQMAAKLQTGSPLQLKEQADKIAEDYAYQMSQKYGGFGKALGNMTPEEKSKYSALEKEAEKAQSAYDQSPDGIAHANAEAQEFGFPPVIPKPSQSPAQLAFDKVNKEYESTQAQYDSLKTELNNKYGAWNKATPEEKAKLSYLNNASYDMAVEVDKAQAELDRIAATPVGNAHTALADFEGAMEQKYPEQFDPNEPDSIVGMSWHDQMTPAEEDVHNQLISDVMSKEAMPKGYETVDVGPAWTHQIEDFIQRPVADHESKAISYYSSSSTAINRFLGTGQKPQTGPKYFDELQKHIAALDSVLSNASAPKQLVIYRGESTPEIWNKVRAVPEGGTYVNHAFTSTSQRKDTAKGFEHYAAGMFTLIVPKGSKVIPFSGHSGLASEDELLIARDAEYKIIQNTSKHIILELLPHGE